MFSNSVALRSCVRCRSLRIRGISRPNRLFTNTARSYSSAESSTSTAVAHEAEADPEESDRKINTWFLNHQPTRKKSVMSTPSSSSFSDNALNNGKEQIPSTFFTNSNVDNAQQIHSIPKNTPAILLPLHEFMISPKSEATEVIHRETVQIFDCSLLSQQLDLKGQGDLVNSIDIMDRSGSYYDWIILVQVKGRGRGVVARGDGLIRRWLLKNPLHSSIKASPHEYPKTPRISPDSDWSIIPLDLGSTVDGDTNNFRACINLVSEEGKERWKLEEMWGLKP
ncbi:uncharacterized protein L201_002999 [Kwoniella dendrophila CBS 6074]|uniref:Uncharacterized protein n=1 Tax=Kwoniella dendrophila CBS 6074 TaxID=1295534 RepID=A0AAX4JU67_9TREE